VVSRKKLKTLRFSETNATGLPDRIRYSRAFGTNPSNEHHAFCGSNLGHCQNLRVRCCMRSLMRNGLAMMFPREFENALNRDARASGSIRIGLNAEAGRQRKGKACLD